MRDVFAAGLSALLVIFVLVCLPAYGGMMDKEKAMDRDKAMMEKPGGMMMKKEQSMKLNRNR